MARYHRPNAHGAARRALTRLQVSGTYWRVHLDRVTDPSLGTLKTHCASIPRPGAPVPSPRELASAGEWRDRRRMNPGRRRYRSQSPSRAHPPCTGSPSRAGIASSRTGTRTPLDAESQPRTPPGSGPCTGTPSWRLLNTIYTPPSSSPRTPTQCAWHAYPVATHRQCATSLH